MKYKVERLEMSGKPRVMWAIVNENNDRQFPTELGFSAWLLKREATAILNAIKSKGMPWVVERFAKTEAPKPA